MNAPSQQRETLYDGDTFDHRGYTFRVRYERDDDHGAPWEEGDGHGIVSDWTTRDKAPGERVLCVDRHHRRYYDVKATLRLARQDGWGCAGGQREGESARSYAARAVEADFEYLHGWCTDRWEYVGAIVTWTEDENVQASLWGIESSEHAYLTSVAYELADELMTRIEVDDPDVVVSEN